MTVMTITSHHQHQHHQHQHHQHRFEVVNVERKGKKGAAMGRGVEEDDGADGMEEVTGAEATAAAGAGTGAGATDDDAMLKGDYMAVMSQRSKVRI